MAPAVREKVSKKPANRVEKPAIWQDVMVEVKETFRRIDKVTHSGFTLWDERCVRSGPTLSRNRMARIKTQAPLRNFNLPPRTLRELQNNRSQPPIVSFNHLQNLLGMCRRINAQSLLRERRKNPHDPSLYPVFLRRPVARPSTPLPARTPPTSSTPRRASSTGTDHRRRSSTPPSAPVSRPFTPPVSARKRPLTARPSIDDPPYAYAPRRFTLLLDISNRPATLGPLPPFATRPPSTASTPRPGSSRSQKGEQSSKPADQEQPHKKPRPPIPSLRKLPAERPTPRLASDRTFDRSSTHSGSMSSFGPMAAAYFDRRPHSAGDQRPLSGAGEMQSERPPSRRQAGASANRPKPPPESRTRGLALQDVLMPDGLESSASSLLERTSPTTSSSSTNSNGSSTTMPNTVRSEATTSTIKGKSNRWSQSSECEVSGLNSDGRPPSRRGAKPSQKKKRAVAPSETTTLSTTTTTDPSTQEASDDNSSGKALSNARGQTEVARRPNAVVGSGATPHHRTRSSATDNAPRFIIEIKTPRAMQVASSVPSLSDSVRGKAKLSPSSAKAQELLPPLEEPSPGRPKVTFAAPSDIEAKKKEKVVVADIIQPTSDQTLDQFGTPHQRKTEASSGEAWKAKEENLQHRHMALTGVHTHAHTNSVRQSSLAVGAASEEEDPKEGDSSGEDSIKTITGIQSCSETSSEMSANERDDDDDDEHEEDTDRQHEAHVGAGAEAGKDRSRGVNLRDVLQEEALSHTERQEDEEGREGENPSSVFVKYSADAYVDFKSSMMNLIRNEHLENGPEDQLNELFQYYIDLNPSVHHNVLLQVIADIKMELIQAHSLK